MNRHHPYNSNFEHSPGRRGNYSPGHGSDRGSYRSSERGGFRGRGGFNRGRGGYSSYDSNISNHQGSYDHGNKQSDIGGYNAYDHQPNSYYQNEYSDSTPAQFSSQSPGYNQGYPKFEGAPQLRLNVNRKDREQRHYFPSDVRRRVTSCCILRWIDHGLLVGFTLPPWTPLRFPEIGQGS